MLVRTSEAVARTGPPRPGGSGIRFGTSTRFRAEASHLTPLNSSSARIRRYCSLCWGLSVRYFITTRLSGVFRLLCRETSGLTAEIVPPAAPLSPPSWLPPSRPPPSAGSAAGTASARPRVIAPIRRPNRTGAVACPPPLLMPESAGFRPRGAAPKTRPHWASRSRPSASSIIRYPQPASRKETQEASPPPDRPAATEYRASSGSPAAAAVRAVTASVSTSSPISSTPDTSSSRMPSVSGAGIANSPTSLTPCPNSAPKSPTR